MFGNLVGVDGNHPGHKRLPHTFHILKIYRISLLGHRGTADLFSPKSLAHFSNFSALQMPEIIAKISQNSKSGNQSMGKICGWFRGDDLGRD